MADSKDIAISVKNVYKDFYLPRENSNSLKTRIVRIFDKKKGGEDIQHVLKGVSFDINKGEFFGIVGRNGSGKSTLLKIISEIYRPTKGTVQVNGRLVPFIELGVGFNPELTGRENVYLNGALLGFTRGEVKEMYDEIVEFAELKDFMDQKLKNYSSGMQVRLAFSVAIKAKGDILVLDEVLAVGDEAFQRKCAEYFRKIKNDKTKTVILVTHSMDSVREYCNRALLLDRGVVEVNSTNVDTVADSYTRLFIKESDTSHNQQNRFGSGEIVFDSISHRLVGQEIVIEFDLINKTDEMYENVFVGVNVRHNGSLVTGNHLRYADGYRDGLTLRKKQTKHVTLRLDNILSKNDYTIDLNVRANGGTLNFDTINNAIEIPSANPSGSKYYKVQMPLTVTEAEK